MAASTLAAAAAPYTIDGGSGGGASGRPSIDFSAALSIWRDINLVELQNQLNTTAPELLQAQKAAVANRKNLADQTREFKKQPDANKLESFKPLLKAYQTEIDTLTKRSKAAENAFINVHAALTKAPDPYPLLEITLEQAASLNDLDTLRRENAQLKSDLALHSAEADASKAREAENAALQQRLISLEQDFDARLQQRTTALESEFSAKWDERIRNLKERETDLTKSLNLAQEQLQLLKSRDETATARLLEKGHHDDDSNGANGNFAEVEMLSRDLERAHARVENVERRNEQLRVEIESVKSGRAEGEKLRQLENESRDKDRKLLQIQSMLDTQRQQSADLTKHVNLAREEKLKLQSEKDAEIESLRSKLQQRSDYADIKRELEIVKAVHFNVEDDDDACDVSVMSPGANGDGDQSISRRAVDSLEKMLLEKNKRLEDQLATMRVSNAELSASLSKTTDELTQLQQEHSRIKSLNERLEMDLASVGRDASRSGSTSKGAAAMSAEEALREMESLEAQATQPHSKASRAASSSATTKEQSNGTKSTTIASPKASTPGSTAEGGGGGGGESSILPIVTSQRDRFRTRNAELEEELRRQFSTISELRAEIKTLQSDNLGLYEKVRYLQSYGPTSSRAGDAPVTIGVSARSDYPPASHDKYRARYEESMNPFEAFRGREQVRAMSQLNPLERALHILTRVVLSHRRMRLFFMAYAICLHLLIFGMLLEVSSTSSAQTCSLPKQ